MLGTFGRGFYVLDDYSPLREVTAQALAQEAELFPLRHAYQYDVLTQQNARVGQRRDAEPAVRRASSRITSGPNFAGNLAVAVSDESGRELLPDRCPRDTRRAARGVESAGRAPAAAAAPAAGGRGAGGGGGGGGGGRRWRRRAAVSLRACHRPSAGEAAPQQAPALAAASAVAAVAASRRSRSAATRPGSSKSANDQATPVGTAQRSR